MIWKNPGGYTPHKFTHEGVMDCHPPPEPTLVYNHTPLDQE